MQMLVKNPLLRRGIAWLEPANVVMKYHQTEERQAMADVDFMRGLEIRLGLVLPRDMSDLVDPDHFTGEQGRMWRQMQSHRMQQQIRQHQHKLLLPE